MTLVRMNVVSLMGPKPRPVPHTLLFGPLTVHLEDNGRGGELVDGGVAQCLVFLVT